MIIEQDKSHETTQLWCQDNPCLGCKATSLGESSPLRLVIVYLCNTVLNQLVILHKIIVFLVKFLVQGAYIKCTWSARKSSHLDQSQNDIKILSNGDVNTIMNKKFFFFIFDTMHCDFLLFHHTKTIFLNLVTEYILKFKFCNTLKMQSSNSK